MAQTQAQAKAGSEKNIVLNKASKYAEVIATMDWDDVLLSSIKLSNKWTKLVQYEDIIRKLFKCNLCGIVQYGVKNMYAHIGGKKHKHKMNEVTELYNPKLKPPTIKLMEPLTTKANKETINSTKSVTKPTTTDGTKGGGGGGVGGANDKNSSKKGNLNLLAENKEKNSDETTTTTPSVVQNKSVGDSNKNSSSTNDDDIIVIQENSNVATPLGSSEGKSNDSDAPTAREQQNVKMINEEMEVPNPFSQTNGGGGQCKIACVSLSKLIDCKTEEDEKENDTEDVIEISDNDNDDTAKTSNQQEGDKNKSRSGAQQQPQGAKPSSSNINIPTIHSSSTAVATAKRVNIQRPSLNKSELLFDSDRIDNKVERYGFLGVEYVIKVLKKNDFTAPRYECSLCELILMGQEMQRHLLGYNHRLKYCQKHFPTAIRQYQQYMSDVPEHEIFKVMTPVLEKLAIAIEKHHGKSAPYKCYSTELDTNRHDIFSKVYSRRHASEQHGPTFTHVLDAEEIRFLVQNRNNLHKQSSSGNNPNQASGFNDQNYRGYNEAYFQYDMSPFGGGQSYSHNEAPMLDNETHKMMVENFLKETSRNDPNDSDSRRYNAKRPARSISHERKRLRSERKSVSPLRDGDIWQAYRHMVDIKIYDLEKKYYEYKKDPEQHPQYNEEWQKFWKRRKDDLIRSGIDHRLYNYQNEWSIFFKSHMHELYKQNLEDIKIQCRERLYLPMTNDELADPKYHVVNNESNENSSDDVCEVENEERPHKNNYEDREELLNRNNINTEDQNKSSPDLIHVLRILAALEEHLGSLGPKITEMLSKALLLSKFSPSGIEDSFLTRANCIILETCVEKFKGFLYAGLTDTTKRRALNKAIEETDAFLKTVMPKVIEEEKNSMKLSLLSRKLSDVEQSPTRTTATTTSLSPHKRSFPTQISVIEKAMPSNVSQTQQLNNRQETSISSSVSNQQLSGNIRNELTESEKSELASKLAASLIAKGKGDFNPEQIRKIIDIYFAIINKKSNETGGSSTSPNSMDDFNQNLVLNTIIQSFINQNPKTGQSMNTNEQQRQYGNMNRNENPSGSQMTNQNQQQQYFNMNTNQNLRNTQMSNSNQQQLLQQFQQFKNMNSNQNPRTSTNEMLASNQQQQYASQSNNIMPNNMNYQQQQSSNLNMMSSVRGGGPNLASSATALPNLMNMRNINMNTTSSEQNLRQNVPSFMNNLNNQYPSNNFQPQGFGGINRGGGGGGGGDGRGTGTGAFNQHLPAFLNNLNVATRNNNTNNYNNNNNSSNAIWSRMMNHGNNQPINNSNQFRGRNTDNNMNNAKRQPFWK